MTKTRDLSDFLIEGGADLPLGKPHIVPGVLQPAVAGKDLSGTALGGSYVYGTAHTDGHSYYYTDIKGSKPIKDPRIGAHFGSQRHKARSIQLLEQETATHGQNVYSIDGREWMRIVDSSTNNNVTVNNQSAGNYLYLNNTTVFIEFTAYFSSFNFIHQTEANRKYRYSIDGATEVGTDYGNSTANSPLGSRYVDAGSLVNVPVNATLGIHTIKLRVNQADNTFNGIELIAQDTTSTATKSKIQIPVQNVVSFGKKFSVSGTSHYDPFTTMSYGGSGTTLSALGSLIDTDTSLGMDAWKAGTSNYHRPWNGGRVIKWVDSSGTIKTSVNMMPPNAQNIGTTASNAVSDAHVIAGTNDDTINFNTSAVDHAQSEVAKTYYYREFGNGAANEGSSTSGTKQDFSMLNFKDSVAYVMDDGLTSMTGTDVTGEAVRLEIGDGNNDALYLTFIGTGIYYTGGHTGDPGPYSVASNLPYGTHVLKINRLTSSSDTGQLFIDGANIWDQPSGRYGMRYPFEFTIYQPKRPPIPEDACVLADYMLMADFVPQTTAGTQYISKGVRKQNISRDVFIDETDDGSITFLQQDSVSEGFEAYLSGTADSDTSFKMRIPSFGTNYVHNGYQSDTRVKLFVGDTSKDDGTNASAGSVHIQSDGSTRDNSTSYGSYAHLTSDLTLGIHQFGANAVLGQNGVTHSFGIATPIHTSSHYQAFETPFLHELVGGDRNMEQHNLVVSPDGKTWDQITRDTSYIGRNVVSASREVDSWFGDNTHLVFDRQRGGNDSLGSARYTKDSFALAYDRYICLKEGQYKIVIRYLSRASNSTLIKLNGTRTAGAHHDHSNYSSNTLVDTLQLERGDYVQIYDEIHGGVWAHFYIEKV